MLISKWQNNIKAKREKYLASRPRPKQIVDYSEDKTFKDYLDQLYELRKDGAIKLDDVKTQIRDVKANKLLDKAEKAKLLDALNDEILKAKIVIARDHRNICKIVCLKIQLLKRQFKRDCKKVEATVTNEAKRAKEIEKLKQKYDLDVEKAKNILVNYKSRKAKLNAEIKKINETNLSDDKKAALIDEKTVELIGEKNQIRRLVKEATALSKARYQSESKAVKEDDKAKKVKVIEECNKKLVQAKEKHIQNVNRINTSSFKDKQEKAMELQNEKNAFEAAKSGIAIEKNEKIQYLKQDVYGCYLASANYIRAAKNGKRNVIENIQSKFQHFKANFEFMQFLTKYALYMIIILIFIALVIWSATQGVNLLSGDSILTCLRQIAPKIFFSLGAACLILLGGTDLSIGRLTGIGVSFTLMILSSTNYADNNGVVWFATGGMSAAGRIILALLISIGFCTAFTSLSGFFTAKFKIHPFITTLATQLISYGLFQIFWSATSTFSPTDADSALMDGLRGSQGWQLILYAVIAIAIVWFIWNKTKFGKNLYAVGGNAEAAKVSGISPFIITLLAFVMAGILYGCGGFVQAVQTGTGNFTTGYGTETDAIAACVIGGISFTGGIGKVSGAVIGTIVLGFLTFAFSSMGMDANLQLVIKGVIIILAVTLDCVKYIKKK